MLDDLSRQSRRDGFQLTKTKCKELRISFAKNKPNFDLVVVNSKPLESVTSFKILGLNISSDLKWNAHVSELVKKASSRLYFLKQLKRSLVAPIELTLPILLVFVQYWNMPVQSFILPCLVISVKI